MTRLKGKYKLSQNRSQTDQQQVSRSLLASEDQAAQAIEREMQRNLKDRELNYLEG